MRSPFEGRLANPFCATFGRMNKTEVLATAIAMARDGLSMTPAAAIDEIAALIGREDPGSVDYDRNVEQLLRLAACVWALRHRIFLPSLPGLRPHEAIPSTGHAPA